MHNIPGSLFLALLLLALPALAAPSASEENKTDAELVTMDFNDVDINVFIKYISELTGVNFVVDREVRGKVNIVSPVGVSPGEAYRIFESALEVNGYAAIPSGSVVKIVPSAQARAKNVAAVHTGALNSEDRMITRIVQLEYAQASELRNMLAPLVPKTGVLSAHDEAKVLTITDYQSNIARLEEIIRTVDVPAQQGELAIITLKHASSANAARVLAGLFGETAQPPGKAGGPALKIVPYERANALALYAPAAELAQLRAAIAKLDVASDAQAEQLQVIPLQYARAEELVKVLMDLPREEAPAVQKDDGMGARRRPVLTRDINIVADTETNSLVINGPREEFEAVAAIVRQLDIPRRMIYLEALIMEVEANKNFHIGVQWGGTGTFSSANGQLHAGFSGSADNPYSIITGMRAGNPILPGGFSLGVLKKGIEIGGVTFPNLGAVVNAYKNDEDINVIATPQILATDNKKAAIKVGENVPYIVSKNTTESQQDYTNYEYKDVATSLEITPQINQADTVRMEIGVEVVKLKDLNNGNPTTSTRTAKTTVVVHNEQTVVIGGMIGQDSTRGEYKTPFLGDLPLLGRLFKSKSGQDKKTNLFIFITPHILEHPEEAEKLFQEKRGEAESVHHESGDAADSFLHRSPGAHEAAILADMGAIKLREGLFAEARGYFQRALNTEPGNLAALVNMGLLAEREGKSGDAALLYDRALARPVAKVSEDSAEALAQTALRDHAAQRLHSLKKHGGKKK